MTENVKTTHYGIFFLLGFSFTATDDSQDSKGREGTIFYSTLPLPPADEHSDIYLQLCIKLCIVFCSGCQYLLYLLVCLLSVYLLLLLLLLSFS